MGVLSINTDATDQLVAKLSSVGTSIGSAKHSMDGGFSRLKGSNRLYGGISKISGNFSVVGDRFSKLSRNISKHSNEIVETDLKLSKLADDIVIPEDLKTVDSAYNVEVNATVLNKEDGKSVKTGETDLQNYDDDSKLTKEDQFKDINNSSATTSEFADQYTEDKKDLDDITTASGTEAQALDETRMDKIGKRELDSINTASLEKEELNDSNFNKIKDVNIEAPNGIYVEIPDENEILKYLV